MAAPYQLSSDGIENQACNGVGHFALTIPLLPILESTAAKLGSDNHVRIVNLASSAQYMAFFPDFSTLQKMNRHTGSAWMRYGDSKLSVSAMPTSGCYRWLTLNARISSSTMDCKRDSTQKARVSAAFPSIQASWPPNYTARPLGPCPS
jgi:hypothetical protein